MNIVKFLNFTDRDFTWSWDRVPHTFKAQQSVMLEDWKAEHFAKHLVDRELHREGLQVSDEKRSEYLKMALIDTELEVGSQAEADMVILNAKNTDITSELKPMEMPPKPQADVKDCCGAKKFAHHKPDCPNSPKDETPTKA